MTDTGHEARARAVVEQIQRRHTREVRAEVPPAVRGAIMEVAERMAALEHLAAEQAGTIARLTAELVETKADLERFRANIREIGTHLTERAA